MARRANWKGFLRLSGHRIKYLKVDADTGEEVSTEDIEGYVLDEETFAEMSKEELEEIALESTRTIEIDAFVDRSDIGPRYLIRPYYIRVIRQTVRDMDKVAIGRVVLTDREHMIALEPMDKGQEAGKDGGEEAGEREHLDNAARLIGQWASGFQPA